MLPRLKQAGKILTSGVLFTLLGVGGCLYTLFVHPVLVLLPGGVELRQRRVQRAVRLFFKLFVIGLSKSGILRVETSGFPSPGALAGSIVVANHPSYLDIVILIALLPEAVCVVKEGVWHNPFFGRIVQAAGFITNEEPGTVLEHCRKALAMGRTLVIFPEGSRTRPGQALKFHRGAAHLALRTGAPVLPFSIQVDPPLLAKGDRWYHISVPTCVFKIASGPRLSGVTPEADDTLFLRSARTLTRAMEEHYLKSMT
jgi:1-acyl-sn-glycerol-3-phosphate acyltransferase